MNSRNLLQTLILLIVPLTRQFVGKESIDKYLYEKPMVVPSAEVAYHSHWIEYDTMATGNVYKPMFAKIYISLEDGKFTFGGHSELVKSSEVLKDCVFVVERELRKLCDHQYFVLTNDLINLVKVVYNKDDDLDTMCKNKSLTVKKDLKYEDKNNFVMKYGNRVLMMYKENTAAIKCIGTYDMYEDVFSCLSFKQGTSGNITYEPVLIENFLYDPVDETWIRERNTVLSFLGETKRPLFSG